ncbi:MAG: hypothetical protein ACE5HO_12180, partial [bacterium]
MKAKSAVGLIFLVYACHQTVAAQEWSVWRNLGRRVAPDSVNLAGLVVGVNEDERQEVFVESEDGRLWHIWQKYINSGWSKWSAMATPAPQVKLRGGFAVWQNEDGRQELFATSESGALWHVWQKAPNSGWSKWKSLASPPDVEVASIPAVGRNEDGRQEVAVFGSDGALWHIWQKAPNASWRNWQNLGAPESVNLTSSPVGGQNADGRLELFAVCSDGALWHIWQKRPNESWGKWKRLGSPANVKLAGRPVLSQNQDGRMEIFLLAQGGVVWHRWQTHPNGGWSKWKSLGSPATSKLLSVPRLGRNQDGRLELFAIGSEGGLWHVWQKAPNSGWKHWKSLDAPQGVKLTPHLGVGKNQDGRIEAFAIGSDRVLW